MSDVAKGKKHRSPAYPFVSLPKAIKRAGEFYAKEKRHSAPVASALKSWGFSEKSSGGQQTLAALKQFGLLSDEGSGESRRLKLTNRAFQILLDEVEDSPHRWAAIREAARGPKLFAEMLHLWGIELPSDDTIRTFLRRDKGFNDDVLGTVIRSYKETLAFAKLSKSDTIQEDDSQTGDVDSGDEMTIDDPLELGQKPLVKPPTGTARDVFNLDGGGEAVLQYPKGLTANAIADLEEFVSLVIKRLKRGISDPPNG